MLGGGGDDSDESDSEEDDEETPVKKVRILHSLYHLISGLQFMTLVIFLEG